MHINRFVPMTLSQALRIVRTDKSHYLSRAVQAVAGRPTIHPSTAVALRAVAELLPPASERIFTVDDFISAALEVDSDGNYRLRERAPSFKLLDAMLTRYLAAHPGAMPSKITVLQLAAWLQDNPAEGERAPAQVEVGA